VCVCVQADVALIMFTLSAVPPLGQVMRRVAGTPVVNLEDVSACVAACILAWPGPARQLSLGRSRVHTSTARTEWNKLA